MDHLRHRIISSIDNIDKSDWDAIVGDAPEGYCFYKALESSNLGQFRFLYITLEKNNTTLLIAPLFISELNLDIVMGKTASCIIKAIRKYMPGFFTGKFLFCGSPFGENGLIGIRPGLGNGDTKALVSHLSKVMNRLCRKNKINFIAFKDFLEEDAASLESLINDGFFRVHSLPSVKMEIGFKTMEDYYNTLRPSARKDFKRKLNKAKKNGCIMVEITDNIESSLDRIHELYLNTYNCGDVKFEKLTKDFFLQAAKHLKPNAKFFLYYVNGNLAAFNLCIIHNDTFIDKFIGFDYDLSSKHDLYYISWHYNIEWCLKNSIKYYQVGQTDYEPKLSLGGKAVSLYAYSRHRNPVINLMLKGFTKAMKL